MYASAFLAIFVSLATGSHLLGAWVAERTSSAAGLLTFVLLFVLTCAAAWLVLIARMAAEVNKPVSERDAPLHQYPCS
jgi:hypothetical protein